MRQGCLRVKGERVTWEGASAERVRGRGTGIGCVSVTRV